MAHHPFDLVARLPLHPTRWQSRTPGAESDRHNVAGRFMARRSLVVRPMGWVARTALGWLPRAETARSGPIERSAAWEVPQPAGNVSARGRRLGPLPRGRFQGG